MLFEWDKDKNAQNLRKHGIFDYGEIREISIGAIQGVVIVTVVHTERNGAIRIISARKATRQERKTYYEYLAETT